LTGLELRGCWEAKPEAPGVTVLSTILDAAAHVRTARMPVPAYRPGDAQRTHDFVPVETVATRRARKRRRADRSEAAEPSEETMPDSGHLGEAEPAWDDRTSLFGDPEG